MTYRLVTGECTEVLRLFKPAKIDLVVTSPPYDELRRYNGYTFTIEPICAALYRAVRPGGVVVWVVGDQVVRGSETGSSFRHALAFLDAGFRLHDTMIYEKNSASFPARRNSTRYSQIFEYMFVFSKGAPRTANLICDKPNKWAGVQNWGKQMNRGRDGTLKQGKDHVTPEMSPRNNIWKYSTGGGISRADTDLGDHPAVFPLALAEDHIKTWSNPGDLVLDPMMGSGTTGIAALGLGRQFIGIDISAAYVELARKRIETRTVA